jgi:hypothetical protein
MPTIHQLHSIYLQQLKSIIKESELLLQKEGGLDGELKTSGSICENFIKKILENLCVPGQFRVVSGYIATPDLLKDDRNLPQCDLIIVDKHIPPLFKFFNSDIEVVPRESVCGLIEIKRSLTKDSLYKYDEKTTKEYGGLGQLKKIIRVLGETDTIKFSQTLNAFNRHVGFHNYSSNKPLIGVIALENRINNFHIEVPTTVHQTDSLVDFVWTIDGYALIPGFYYNNQFVYYSHTARPKNATWGKLRQADFKDSESEYYKMYDSEPIWLPLTPTSEQEKVNNFSKMLGMISILLSRTFGDISKEERINEYYLRRY